MTMDRDDPLFALYLELLPVRPTRFDPHLYALGPTAQWELLEMERAHWSPETVEDVA